MTTFPKYEFDLLRKAVKEEILDNEKAFDLIEIQTKTFASVNLPFLSIASSEDFVKFIIAENKVNAESDKELELDNLTNQNKELIEKIYQTPKDTPLYEKLIVEQKQLTEKIANLLIPYAESIMGLDTYINRIKNILNGLNNTINESSTKGNKLKRLIWKSKLRVRLIMLSIATILAIVSDYLTVYIEEFIGIKALHIIIVVIITLVTLIFIEPKLKRLEAKKSKGALSEHLDIIEIEYDDYKKQIDAICTRLGISDVELLDKINDFNKRNKSSQ